MSITDRPDRERAPAGLAAAERELAAGLQRGISRITERWHRDLLSHLKTRPEAVFPGDDLLDHMHLVVLHVISLIEADDEISEETLRTLRGVAGYWADAGYSIEESLLHFRVLNRVLHEELRGLLETGDSVRASHAARIAESLSHGSSLVQAVVVGSYRDHEDDRLDEFVSVLSHEVRGPLSSALAALQSYEILDDVEADGKLVRDVLERIERSLWQVRDVLEAVTALVLPGRRTNESEAWQPLSEILSGVLDECRGAQNEVLVESEGEIPELAVPHDPVLLILHNLVQNGVAYSDPGKPERWVRVGCEYDEERGSWLVRVRDDGVGIAERDRREIFRRFRRGPDARGHGYGLGLSIVREAARRLNGAVTVESEVGEGSTFTLVLPVEKTRPLVPAE